MQIIKRQLRMSLPHLRKKTISTIIDKEKKHYTYHKLNMPFDDYLLKKHLGELIL